jgi:hypothetical protein
VGSGGERRESRQFSSTEGEIRNEERARREEEKRREGRQKAQ